MFTLDELLDQYVLIHGEQLIEDEPDLDPWEFDDIELPPFAPLDRYLMENE